MYKQLEWFVPQYIVPAGDSRQYTMHHHKWAYIVDKIFSLCICKNVASSTNTFYSLISDDNWINTQESRRDLKKINYSVASLTAQLFTSSLHYLPEHEDHLLILPW